MNFLPVILGTLLACFAFANAASAKPAIRSFHRIKDKAPEIEKQEYSRPFENFRLQERASRYLNSLTQSITLYDFARVQAKAIQNSLSVVKDCQMFALILTSLMLDCCQYHKKQRRLESYFFGEIE